MGRKLALALLSLIFISGCVSIDSKQDNRGGSGHPFTGVTIDMALIRCSVDGPARAKKKRGDSYFFSVPIVLLLDAMIILDMPLELLMDIIFLPYDVWTKNPGDDHGRKSVVSECFGEERPSESPSEPPASSS